ncbi:diaminopimelate decarboxylase family protein [Desulfogranum mediterraneum]|uniref:diaminopimelate decarboxylase family protein n=1 Tax=Desulfogranum mediterraneum TaxID=160661 RepID=UPI001ABF2439|nr:hypothetical protein [Desulfogranum mediterraneum]
MNPVPYLWRVLSRALVKKSHVWQQASSLRDPDLWDCTVSTAGHLCVADFDCVELANNYGSPLLVVNYQRLLKDIGQMMGAMRQAPEGSKVLYSYKTNCIPALLQVLHENGLGAEVISPYELWVAHKLNVPGDKLVYNGVDKSDESLRLAVTMDVLAVNVDHREEVQRIVQAAKDVGRRARVGVRLGLSNSSQFGLSVDSGEAMEVCREIIAHEKWLDLCCVHFSVTSNAKDSWIHRINAEKALAFISCLQQELDIQIEYLDIGGGYGVPTTKNMSGVEYGLYRTFGCLPKPADPLMFQAIDLFIGEIVAAVQVSCMELGLKIPKLLIEPGRFITSRSEILLAKVLSVKTKPNGTRFLITDAGRLSMTFPAEFEYHELFVANRMQATMNTNYQVMGRICTSADWLAKNRLLPEAQPGDIIAVMDAGAYFSSYSSTFAFPRPAIVGVDNGKISVLRSPESFEYLTELDHF